MHYALCIPNTFEISVLEKTEDITNNTVKINKSMFKYINIR
jgi:hypothetical protein